MTQHPPRSVLVLGGGPDAERQVSITSAKHVADALRAAGHTVHAHTIDTLTLDALRALPGDVVFPVLHGGWGEGGQLQDLLEAGGRPFVGCGSRAARLAMDKVATKAVSLRIGVPTPQIFILDPRDPVCPLGGDFPVVIKPVHEGSTIGLYICNHESEWKSARDAIAAEFARGTRRSYMVEPRVPGRELTVGIIDNAALPIIEITPAEGLYDYEAKYHRSDTQYTLDPALPAGVADTVKKHAVALARAIGVRHLARVDFMLDPAGVAWMLEINTLPGFTDHSLVPKAAAHTGEPMPALCSRLVSLAVRDATPTP